VYVIPPNENLQVVDRQLVLTPMKWIGDRKAPVDMFFRTLAEAYKAHGRLPSSSQGRDRTDRAG
jgi:two-component system CheB/CheR fusion protein